MNCHKVVRTTRNLRYREMWNRPVESRPCSLAQKHNWKRPCQLGSQLRISHNYSYSKA